MDRVQLRAGGRAAETSSAESAPDARAPGAAADEPDDFIESLGGVVLDHRFMRLTNRLLDEQRKVFRSQGIELGPKWVSTFKLLAREPGLGVSEIARRLRLSHPALIQITRAMARAGLVREADDPDDGRRRLLFLTDEALELRPEIDRLCDTLAEVQVELFREAGCDILDLLDRVGRELRERSVAERVLERLSSPHPPECRR